ncbi:MAG TPA: ABC transporter permease [Gemmatimonadales bacterium]|jgi:putative ABC transport system permease protein
MPLLEAVRLALSSIRAQKLKSFFSLIGVLIGVTFLIAVVSIVQGMNVYMTNKFANAIGGVNTFQLQSRPGMTFGNVTEAMWKEWQRRPKITVEDAAYVEARMRTPVHFSREAETNIAVGYRGKNATGIDLEAVDAEFFDIKHWNVDDGRAFAPQEVDVGAPVVVIGTDLAEGLFPAGVKPVGKTITIGGIPYRVIGVVEKQGTLFGISLDRFAVVPITSPARRLIDRPHVIEDLQIQADDPSQMPQAVDEVTTLMRIRRGLKPNEPDNFAIDTAQEALDQWGKISHILFLALPGLVGISLVVGGIVIMNIMLMSVVERTREIGIRKALGARNQDILAQFVVESATLSLAGAVFGIGSGLGLAFVVRALTPLPAAVAPWSIGLAVGLGILVGMIAGVYPARQASRLDPIVALGHE